MSGAQGYLGGFGGSIQAELFVANDSIVHFYVGGQGSVQFGGWNGGGNSGSVASGGGGGGASDVRIGGYNLNNRVLVAGGGGGYGTNGSGSITGYGGPGGQINYNFTAGNGTGQAYGTGGSISGPGVGGLFFPWGSGNNGSLGVGGSYCSTCFNMGGGQGGGGGGYYGGGAGGANSGGGGGSNWASTIISSNVLTLQGNKTGNGQIIISYNQNNFGCTDSNAINFNPNAICDDSSCIYPIYGLSLIHI